MYITFLLKVYSIDYLYKASLCNGGSSSSSRLASTSISVQRRQHYYHSMCSGHKPKHMLLFKLIHIGDGAVNLRKRYSCKSIINYIRIP